MLPASALARRPLVRHVVRYVVALAIVIGAGPVAAQGTLPAELARQDIVNCMAELGLTAPVASADFPSLQACTRRKADERRPKTQEERERYAQELRERMLKDAADSRARQQDAANAEEARLAEARAGLLGRDMQIAVLCREDLQRQGVKAEPPRWMPLALACAARLRASPPSPAARQFEYGSDAWCAAESKRSRMREGTPESAVVADPAAAQGKGFPGKGAPLVVPAVDAPLCDVLAGRRGLYERAGKSCANELADLYVTPAIAGLGAFFAELERCETARLRELRAAAGGPKYPQPFGDASRIHEYLNALLADDLATIRSTNEAYGNRLGMRAPMNYLTPMLQNYLARYPTAYARCLEPDAPVLVLGDIVEEVTTDGTGLELKRERIDRTRRVPVNRKFYAIAAQIGAGEDSRLDDAFQALGGVYLRDLAPSRLNGVVKEVMSAHACDGELIRRLEQKFIQYAALRG
jgi:hypothetical protein